MMETRWKYTRVGVLIYGGIKMEIEWNSIFSMELWLKETGP